MSDPLVKGPPPLPPLVPPKPHNPTAGPFTMLTMHDKQQSRLAMTLAALAWRGRQPVVWVSCQQYMFGLEDKHVAG